MRIPEFFESKTIELPRGGFRESAHTFDGFLASAFQEYRKCLLDLDDPGFSGICAQVKDSLPRIDQLITCICDAAKKYLRGSPHDAYDTIKGCLAASGIECLITELSQYIASNLGQFDDLQLCTLHPPLYRMRADGSVAVGTISRRDIFHVPFELRSKVQGYRYSIAGLPCLYLGSSTWITWDELGRPDLGTTFVSRFRIAESIKVLDFQLRPRLAWNIFKYAKENSAAALGNGPIEKFLNRYNEDFIESYIVFWPLMAACSIRVEIPDSAFSPQYIVPQLLMEWVANEQKVDGIRYFSTRAAPLDLFAYVNCVFPAKEISNKGHCSYLGRKFHLTAPVPWEILAMYDPVNRFVPGPTNARAPFQLNEDVLVPYRQTEFFRAEAKLEAIEREPDGSKGFWA